MKYVLFVFVWLNNGETYFDIKMPMISRAECVELATGLVIEPDHTYSLRCWDAGEKKWIYE